jgi:hypothetical protein
VGESNIDNTSSYCTIRRTLSSKSMVHSRLGHSLRKVERAGLWIYSNMSQALADVARGARLVASATTCRWRLQAANYCRRIMSCIPNTQLPSVLYQWLLGCCTGTARGPIDVPLLARSSCCCLPVPVRTIYSSCKDPVEGDDGVGAVAC